MMPQYVQVGQMNYAQPPPHTQPQAAIPAQHEHGGAQPPQQPRQSHGGGGGGGGGRGVMIGAAVAVLVVIGVVAGLLLTRDNGKDDKAKTPATTAGTQTTAGPSQSAPPSSAPTTAPGGKFAMVEAEDASPSGGAVAVAGVASSSGKGLIDMSAPGATITWKVEVPKKGTYYLAVKFLNTTSEQQNLSILVNGKDTTNKAKLKNYGTNTVTGTWNMVQLNEGSNDVALTCAAGESCKAALDQVWFENQQPTLK
ncbi:hypothetical protein B4N89_12690 [Embleya scabrispora]|uniref:CBM6 domain-containing protein n=2 Tax=Embleya scabrispora TaxID=159449 RepID=A0A1T3NXY7_9ACTN|nr:hypothetical protein B4N89_12690 [Embleya scabrispora]